MTRPIKPYTPRRRYKKRGPATWAAVREAYLSGATASECAQRFDVTEHALYWRARQGGWRKTDEANAHDAAVMRRARDEAAQAAALPPADSLGAAEIAREALIRSTDAMRDGRARDAHALARVAQSVARSAAQSVARLSGSGASTGDTFRACPVDPAGGDRTDAHAMDALERSEAFRQRVEARAFDYARYMFTGGAMMSAGPHGYWPEFVLVGDRIVRTSTLDPRPEPVSESPALAAGRPTRVQPDPPRFTLL